MSSNFYDYVISKADSEIIFDYYNLDYDIRDKYYWFCCPFHSETKPSFSYNTDTNLFNCWGCKKKGNIISFVKEYELIQNNNELTYYESAKLICKLCNIKIKITYKDKLNEETNPDDISDLLSFDEVDNSIQKQEIFSNDIISKFYNKKNSYMVDRGYNKDILEYLEMGFYTGDNKNLMNDRCIFPVRNIHGELIGWTGRSIFKDAKVKWVHAPSKRFHKSLCLYNIDKAITHIEQTNTINVVESVCNLITMLDSGRYNTVATLGSTVSKEQCEMLKTFNCDIVIWYDWDSGGFYGINLFLEYFDNYDMLYVAITDYGKDENNKSYDLGDVLPYDVENTKVISMYEYIEYMKGEYIANMDDSYTKDTKIKLIDGTEVLCVQKLNKRLEIPQFTKNDISFIKQLNDLLGSKKIVKYGN